MRPGPVHMGERIDVALVRRGMADSRTKAHRLIASGVVSVDGSVVAKPSAIVSADAPIEVEPGPGYVSRGALKLVGAFESFARYGLTAPRGMDCLDIGASTGGFTQVLLRGGAGRVIALDVGHGQLHPDLAHDPRVVEMSGVNIRDVEAGDLPFVPELVVSDVSFISMTLVIPVISRITRPGARIVVLVKPQFEVGRRNLGHHGVVRDEGLRRSSLDGVSRCAADHGLDVVSTAESPVVGIHGNREYLLYAVRR